MPSEILNILIQLPLLAIFIWYYDRISNRNAAEIEKLAKQFQDFLREERTERVAYMAQMLSAMKALQEDFETHDRQMSEAITRMEERTKPRPSTAQERTAK
jgi:hypothetical protein